MAMPHAQHFPQVNGAGPNVDAHVQRQRMLSQLNETTWQRIGSLNELTGDLEAALFAYEQALRHNQWSTQTLNAISCILRTKEKYPEAMEFLKNILKVEPSNGEAWGNLGHCYLMMDNLQEAYAAYQQALYYLPDPKEPKLWYGIGILYDRYGSLEHAEEAFSQVMRMQPDFEKANEIYFRLGIIYKQQQKFQQSLECFKYIVSDPPRPLNEEDIWFQIGHVHEQQKDYESAKAAYRRVLDRDPKHAKVLQQLGWLHHQQSNSYQSQDQAIEYLEQSVSSDNSDAQSWYLLGRCYMAQQKFPKAYEAYQQAVYRDGRNPTFWCSIGVLYYQINQYRDALDAYSRAIRLNPYISEVWYDLGTLYESCNNQTSDALDAYARAAELDPNNTHIKARLQLLKSGIASGQPNQHSAPVPQDVHPQAYQNGVGVPPGVQWGGQSVQQPPQQPPVDPQRASEWTRGIAGLHNPPTQPPPHQQGSYESHDSLRGPPPRQPSPRQEPPRLYQDPARQASARKMQSPSPKGQHSGMYPSGGQTLPQINPQERPGLGPAPRPSPSMNGAPPQPPSSSGGHNSNSLPPYGRAFSPPTLRPIRDERPPSASSNYHHPQLPPAQSFPPISNGPQTPSGTAPTSATSEMHHRDRDDRPASAMKRTREWEAEGPSKKLANEETRSRLEDHSSRRFSPPSRLDTPRGEPHRVEHYRRSSSERREAERRVNETYHPSEAAHHPQIPSMHTILDNNSNSNTNNNSNNTGNSGHSIGGFNANNNPTNNNSGGGGISNSNNNSNSSSNSNSNSNNIQPKDERKEPIEVAARKVDVDEDYDNTSEDGKLAAPTATSAGPAGARSSPNGSLGAAPKQEAAAA